MEIIIAILWYLQLIFAGNTYTSQEIDALIIDNQASIEAIQSDQQKMNNVMDSFKDETDYNSENGLIEVWEEDPEPILN